VDSAGFLVAQITTSSEGLLAEAGVGMLGMRTLLSSIAIAAGGVRELRVSRS
jgi:hypothetical protein